jgi:polyphosphate glucokinase
VASRVKTELNLSWEEWSVRLSKYLEQVDRLFCPELVILGGGISREADRFLPRLSIRGEIRAAELVNNAGIVGAVRLAAESRS